MESVIELSKVTKQFRGFSLKGVDLSVPKGYIMGLIGPNGAGKTTLIKLITHMIRPTSGSIRVFGLDVPSREAEIKARIGVVTDTPIFPDDVPLATIGSALQPFYPKWDKALFGRLLEEFCLPPRQVMKKMSLGMKMKFALTIALSHDADLIIMDEPTAGLDPVFRLQFLDRLAVLIQNENKTVLFSSHITSDLERVADFITFINRGEIVFSASRDEIREGWGVLKTGRDEIQPREVPGMSGYRTTDYGIEILTSRIGEARRLAPATAVCEPVSLEEIMVLAGKGGNHD